MFERVSRSLKYDSIFFGGGGGPQTLYTIYVYIYMERSTPITLPMLMLYVRGNNMDALYYAEHYLMGGGGEGLGEVTP